LPVGRAFEVEELGRVAGQLAGERGLAALAGPQQRHDGGTAEGTVDFSNPGRPKDG
jgi:hypothetical protein